MALRNYVMQNKKKVSAITAAFLLVIAAIIVIAHFNIGTKADVFQKDRDGKVQLKQEINVLEIVAEYGQQVIGYTVSGYEPITKEQIENYHGDIDIQDFRNATGYELQKSGSGDGSCYYSVRGNVLNNTFRKNVLDESIDDGKIIVTVCQANEVTKEMIESADLVYLNSNNYNDNLFYYYDQIVNNGEKGIVPGETGAAYSDNKIISSLKKDVAIQKIQRAAGRDNIAKTLTERDFAVAGIQNFHSYNFASYVNEISVREKGSLTTATDEDFLDLMRRLIEKVDKAEESQLSVINGFVGRQDLTEEEHILLTNAMLKAPISNYYKANNDDYIDSITKNTRAYASLNSINTMMNTLNAKKQTEAYNNLKSYKASGSAENDLVALGNDIIKLEYNYNELNMDLSVDYAAAFADEAFHFTNASNKATVISDIQSLINQVNEKKRQEALHLIADAPANSEAMALLQENPAFYFELAGIEGYDKYNAEAYLEALAALEDKNALKGNGENSDDKETSDEVNVEETSETETTEPMTDDETSVSEPESTNQEETTGSDEEAESTEEPETSDGETESSEEPETSDEESESSEEPDTSGEDVVTYNYDYDKIKEFIETVNAENLYSDEELPYDISWENALELYNYAIVDEKGLMYDTQLLTSGVIGDFTQNLETNTNNLYKILLLMRQLQPEYCINSVLPKIDVDAVYETDTNEKVSAWYKYTFYQEGSQDYSRFREPNVVGQTYSVTGVSGNVRNYVYKHIYSYTGDQFFGGALFVGQSLEEFLKEGGVITPGVKDYIKSTSGRITEEVDEAESDGLIFLDATKADGVWANVTSAYAYFWKEGTSAYTTTVEMTKLDGANKKYKVRVPENVDRVIFKPYKDDWSGQSRAVLLSEGICFYKTTGSKVTTSGDKMSFGCLTNSKQNGTVYYSDELNLEFKAFNVGTATYQVNGGAQQTIQPGETITIGRDLTDNAITNITLKYDNISKNYTYKKISYEYSAENVNKYAEVQYYKTADISFSFTGLENVEYSIDSGSKQTLSSGQVISIGEGIKEGTRTSLTVTYNVGGNNFTRKYYLLKVSSDEIELASNFLSFHTADNTSSLPQDALLDESANKILSGNKGEVLRYIMGISLNYLASYPFNVLEIQPAASVTIWDSYEGALKLAEYLKVEVPAEMTKENYSDYFNVTHMSIREFNTRNEDLTGTYDLIYFGIDSGYQVVNEYTVENTKLYRTKYNDTSMNGLVYTGIGDRYEIQSFLKGTASDDYVYSGGTISNQNQRKEYEYWKEHMTDQFRDNQNPDWNLNLDAGGTWLFKGNTPTTTRLLGNDIAVKKMNELLGYVKAGYPILLPEEIYNCDSDLYIDFDNNGTNAAKWRYVDVNSKMYHFITTIKSLGYNESTNEFDGLDENGNFIFTDGKTYPNIVREIYARDGRNPDNLRADQKFNGGLSYATKRNVQVEFSIIKTPQEYDKDINGNPIAQGNQGTRIPAGTQTYTYELKIDSDISLEWVSQNYAYQIYLDKSGSGRFNDSTTIELDPAYRYNENDRTVILEGRWPGDMDGFMPWKVVAYNKNNPENHFTYTGFSAFEIPASKRKPVYVLWIRSAWGGAGGTLTLDFNEMMGRYAQDIAEYDIKLLHMDYVQFSNAFNRTPNSDELDYDSNNTILRLSTMIGHGAKLASWSKITAEEARDNPELDMIVFGFCDSHSQLDLQKIAAHKNIDYFVSSGHSLLFAHDNVSYQSSLNYYVNLNNGTESFRLDYNPVFARYNTAFFRKMLGMDVYGATYSGQCFDEGSDEYLEYLANTRKYLRDDVSQKDFRGIIETCVFRYTQDYQGNKLYSENLHGSVAQTINDWQRTQTVRRINQGQISEYPYIIGEYLPTASTHTQYMNLNMEDDDITVWYTLSCDTNKTMNQENSKYYMYTEGDGSNNYYIYSKGNITYTGAGHSSGTTGTEERLFVNTVIAAIKAGNFAPEVTFPDADKSGDGSKNIVYRYQDSEDGVTISWSPIDYDESRGSKVFTDHKIYIDMDEDGEYDPDKDILLYDGNPDPNTDRSHTKVIDPATGNLVSILADELENREKYSFKLTNDTITDIVSGSQQLNSIYDKPIAVQITDNGTDKDPSNKRTVSNRIWIVEAKLNNLN